MTRLRLQRLHEAQHQINANLVRFNVLACGRRFGKDIYEMNKAAECAVEGGAVGFGAPTYRMLLENWAAMVQLLAQVTTRRSVVERRLELTTGGVVDFYSLDKPDVIRGRKYHRFIINEAGFVPDLMDTWNFIIRPTLADYKGDAIIGGTPKGRNGFWQMYQRGQDDAESDWRSWHFTSYDNPHIDPAELDEMVRSMPERVARQEVYAEFIDDAGGVFRGVMAAATGKEQAEAIDGHEYAIGVDWGKSNDFTVLTVLDVTERAVAFMDRFNKIDYTVQTGRLKALAQRFRPFTIYVERNSMGEPLVEQLVRDGLPVQPFQTTNATKAAIIDALALAFEQQNITILNDPVSIGELQAFEMNRLPSGLSRYSAPEGLHDDTVMSLALAWQACGQDNWWFA